MLKVSFVPDHVHLAVRTHPSVVPSVLVTELLNVAQEVIWADFAGAAIQASIPRLWQPGAYIGSFLQAMTTSCGSSQYLHNWAQADERATMGSLEA